MNGAGFNWFIAQLRAMAALAWLNGVVAAMRAPLWIASYITPPLSILIILRFVSYGSAMSFGIVGGLAMIIVSNGLGLLSDAATYRLHFKFQDLMVAGPVSQWAYMLGLALSGLLFSAPGIAVFIALMGILGIHVYSAAEAAAAIAMLWAASAGMGFSLSLVFRDLKEVWSTTSILVFAISVLPPVYYPLTALPEWLRYVSLISPTASAAALLQESMGLIDLGIYTRIISLALLVAEAAVFFAVAALKKSS
ncbi:MAG: ABC transporter permease [Nitrososphaeria archaeon]